MLLWSAPNNGPISILYRGDDMLAAQCIVYDIIQKHKASA